MAVVQLKTNLRLTEAVTIIVGSMIGSGILRLPGNMAATLHSPGLVILAWVAGAFLTVMGVLTFAEMAGVFPPAGGRAHLPPPGARPPPRPPPPRVARRRLPHGGGGADVRRDGGLFPARRRPVPLPARGNMPAIS